MNIDNFQYEYRYVFYLKRYAFLCLSLHPLTKMNWYIFCIILTDQKQLEMKTIKYITAIFLLIAGLQAVPVNALAQDSRITRQEMKKIREARMQANYRVLDTILKQRDFVLKAEYLQNRYGDRIIVTPLLNFIKVEGENGILQTGNNTGLGLNGVGGVTAEGNIGKYQIRPDAKRLIYTLQFSLSTNIGHYDVVMTIRPDGSSKATISGTGSDRLTWEGHLEVSGNTRVFKGFNSI